MDWQSDQAFEAAMAAEYLRPEDEVLADMRDECDLRLTVRRHDILIQLYACAKFRGVNVRTAQAIDGLMSGFKPGRLWHCSPLMKRDLERRGVPSRVVLGRKPIPFGAKRLCGIV